MRYNKVAIFIALAILLYILLIPSTRLFSAEWGQLTINQPSDPVKVRIAKPNNWQQEILDSDSDISRGFFTFGKDDNISRGLILTGTEPSDYDQTINNIAAFSKEELTQLAEIIMNSTLFPRNPLTSNLSLVDTITVNKLNALRVRFTNSYIYQTNIIFNIHETVIVIYTNKNNTAKSVIIDCTYTGSNHFRENITKTFENEYNTYCKRFYDSLNILDKQK
ncbi:MAG: hypothetical protein LBE31_10630 [Deltaproteobacteria bacterium]|jgi:hypothetical protein|nr:hypothetical protein [Deltaproteobacteria bacterium]